MRSLVFGCLLAIAAAPACGAGWVAIAGSDAFTSALKYEDVRGAQRIAPFEIQSQPVTNADYAGFVRNHPQWRRGRAPALFAEARYLQHWAAAEAPGAAVLDAQPVVWVSWFAARAYCEAQGARLPSWSEWELVAAADETRADARTDPAWRERILAWYSRPSNAPLPAVAQGAPNLYGVHDLHGLVWEWVDDYSAMLVSPDNRDQGDPDRLQFCGAAGLSTDDRENYAVLMRVAMLSALQAADTTANLGFRCARSLPENSR